MTTKLTFTVESHGKPYAVMVLRDGLVTVRAGRRMLSGTVLPAALQWVETLNPHPDVRATVTIVGRFQGARRPASSQTSAALRIPVLSR